MDTVVIRTKFVVKRQQSRERIVARSKTFQLRNYGARIMRMEHAVRDCPSVRRARSFAILNDARLLIPFLNSKQLVEKKLERVFIVTIVQTLTLRLHEFTEMTV